MLAFSRSDLERLFNPKTLEIAEKLLASNAIVEVNVERDGKSISGRIRGEKRTPYLTRIKISSGRGGRVKLSSTCTCFIYSQCEHAAAALLYLLDQSESPNGEDSSPAIDTQIEEWITDLNSAARNEDADSDHSVLYIVEPAQQSWQYKGVGSFIQIRCCRAKKISSSKYGRDHAIAISNLTADKLAGFITLEDQVIGRLLGAVSTQVKRLSDIADGVALGHILATKRCFWRAVQGQPMRVGPDLKGEFQWKFDSEGQQYLHCELLDKKDQTIVVNLGEPWYLDPENNVCGRVKAKIAPTIVRQLMAAPSINPTTANLVRQKLLPSADIIPMPEPLRKRERRDVKPEPELTLHCPVFTIVKGLGYKREEYDIDVPLAKVSFNYCGIKIGWQDGRTEINHVVDNKLIVLPRDVLSEVQAIESLNALGLQPLGPTGLGKFAPESCRQDFTFEEDDEQDVAIKWVEFNHYDIPTLIKSGWNVYYDENYPYQVLRDDHAWKIDVSDSDIDWFDLSLDIEIDGQRISLLPLLLDLFQRSPDDMRPSALEAYGEELVYGTLPDGRLLPIPAARLKTILEALYDQFLGGHIKSDTDKLSLRKADVGRLALIEQGNVDEEINWGGDLELLEFGKKFTQISKAPPKAIPASLKATLRPYQAQGYNWMDFLGETGLSGILADDMGLGKTIQTLTYLLSEKENGRLNRPALVVAPTSLIPTWRAEARKFAPDLKLLILHGQNRAGLFKKIPEFELALTSYTLMLRDFDEISQYQYRTIILDEAQAIKNPTTKLAKAACSFNADHRIALSGTPIENHLGELWSVFNFLMPGFLGDREKFRKLYRQPIEKDGDLERQQYLASKIGPLLLRRTKEEVASELPEKNEFVREIELTERQREVYESVRLAMHSRIREEIQEKGLQQSNITILDSLLKLRQICCDPRLLKNSDEKFSEEDSSKLDQLLNMSEAMVETGRKLIIFSQFVEMLEFIQTGLKARKIGYTTLTGKTRNREEPVKKFQNGEIPIFLISLKAGGTGLTLTRADTVIHYDPWWNPAVEAQATDRAHRIGQDKTVFVYRLVASGTVEEKMLDLQNRKKNLVDGILGGINNKLSFDEDDLEALFAPIG